MWQDTVIAICQLAFFPSMLPTLLGKDKPALTTSVLNACIVAIITGCFFTMQLWFSFVTGCITACIWAILALQKHTSSKTK